MTYIYFALGDTASAISHWSKALRRSPDSSELILKLIEQDVNVDLLLEENRKIKEKIQNRNK